MGISKINTPSQGAVSTACHKEPFSFRVSAASSIWIYIYMVYSPTKNGVNVANIPHKDQDLLHLFKNNMGFCVINLSLGIYTMRNDGMGSSHGGRISHVPKWGPPRYLIIR